MAEENNSELNQPSASVPISASPEPPHPLQPKAPEAVSAPTPPSPPTPPTQTKRSGKKGWLMIVALVVVFAAAISGAYLFGKHNQRVVIESPPPKPISLPPQAIIQSSCVPGRGKQYIIPKDIPLGPIYDVKNSKVIAVEYNFSAVDLFTNAGNRLSNTIVDFFKNNYQANHLTITAGTLKPGQSQSELPINVAIFVVPKAEANSITCK